MLYPLKFQPVYKKTLWGGNRIRTFFDRDIPGQNIGESWELCCRENGMSIVENGAFQGIPLSYLILRLKEALVGTSVYKTYGSDFPLFYKIIDASDKLSVQVHPDDSYARKHGLKCGKDELWYIIDAPENAKLICGLKMGAQTKAELKKRIYNGTFSQLLKEIAVKPGDFVSVPAGTVHAILAGILIAEVQRNSDTTFRIYDWDRTDTDGNPRELHIAQALDTIRFHRRPREESLAPQDKEFPGGSIRQGPCIGEFQTDTIVLKNRLFGQSDPKSFQVLMNLQGFGKIVYATGHINLSPGITILIPAAMGRYTLLGDMKLLFTSMKIA